MASERSDYYRRMSTTMAPAREHLPDVLPTERLNARAKPTRELRDDLRRIANVRNAVTVLAAVTQSFGLVIAAAYLNTWWAYLVAFVLMARGHVCLAILAHEAAHRLLFTNRTANDLVGRFVCGYPTFQPFNLYRRSHFAHHRDEMGPDEPDLRLYSGYPIPADSWHRKLRRDATGVSAYKELRVVVKAAAKRRLEAWQILATHALMLGVAVGFGQQNRLQSPDGIEIFEIALCAPLGLTRAASAQTGLEFAGAQYRQGYVHGDSAGFLRCSID